MANRIDVDFNKRGQLFRPDRGPLPQPGDELWWRGEKLGDVRECIIERWSVVVVKDFAARSYMSVIPLATGGPDV